MEQSSFMTSDGSPTIDERTRNLFEQYPVSKRLLADRAPLSTCLRHLGLALWLDRRLDEAGLVLSDAASLAPDNPLALADLGCVLSAAGRLNEARSALTASLALRRDHLPAWLALANVESALNDKLASERALLEALRIDPRSKEALTALGLLRIESRRYASAAELIRSALDLGADAPYLHACLGQALFLIGEFSQALDAFEKAVAACPNDIGLIRKLARARFLQSSLNESLDVAKDEYSAVAGAEAEDIDSVGRATFQLLIGFGHHDAAIRLGSALLGNFPDDRVIAYHLDAVRGLSHAKAPARYIVECFDGYADRFDEHLVKALEYDVPTKCHTLLAALNGSFRSALDLGCGTGLFGPFLETLSDRRAGVDLSPRMLDKAKARGSYHELFECEAVDFLEASDRQFDLIVALDVLVYIGDLQPLISVVSARLAPNGIFAISFERGDGETYKLQPTGRFAHSFAYIERLAAGTFDMIANLETSQRLEANAPVPGHIVLLRRKP